MRGLVKINVKIIIWETDIQLQKIANVATIRKILTNVEKQK